MLRTGFGVFVVLRVAHLTSLFVLPAAAIGLLVWQAVLQHGQRRAVRLVAGLCLAVAACGLYGTYVEPTWLRVDHVSLGDPEPGALRIGVIADIQTQSFGEYESDAIALVMEQQADIVLVAGDITQVAADQYDEVAADAVDTLAVLDAPGGVFVVSGNTDQSSSSIGAMAREAGLTPLEDSVTEFEVAGRDVRILGLRWPNNRRERVVELLSDFAATSRDEVIDVVLAHSPDVVLNLEDAASIDVVITGHTHGGQVQIPGFGPLLNVTELPRNVAGGGLHNVEGVPLYVSTGVGVQRNGAPEVRFGVRPSIGVIDIN